MKKLLITSFSVLLLFSLSPAASAASQSVCVNKVSGAVRISDTCKANESKGTRKIIAPKLSKAEQLKKKLLDLESQLVDLERDRKESFESLAGVKLGDGSLDKAIESCKLSPESEICTWYKMSLGPLWVSLDKQYLAVKEVMARTKIALEEELEGYKSISCKKGSEILTITDANPKCPKGYKLKN